MTKEEIKKIIEEKEQNRVFVSSVRGNTNKDSDLGYSYEWYIDCEECTDEGEDEYGEIVEYTYEEWYLYEYRCGNGQGCFGVSERYECNNEDDAYNQLKEQALYGNCTIEFTDDTIINA